VFLVITRVHDFFFRPFCIDLFLEADRIYLNIW
jgi:hypothetical protein